MNDEVTQEALDAVDAAVAAAVAGHAQEWTVWDQRIAAEVFGPAARQVQVVIRWSMYDQLRRRR